MKKLLLALSVICISLFANSQSFTISQHIVQVEGPNASSMDALATMTNVSTDNADTAFSWAIIELNAPAEWIMTFCDSKDCYSSLFTGMNKVFYLKQNGSGPLKATFDFGGVKGIAKLTLLVSSVKNPAQKDTVYYTSTAWPTGLAEASSQRNISVYPNPVKDELNVQFAAKDKSTSIEIYNILGAKVKTISNEGFTTNVNVSDLDNGIYFVRIKDKNNTFTKSFTKVN